MRNKYFIPLEGTHGQLTDMSQDEFPSSLLPWCDGALRLDNKGTHFGYVHTGKATIETSIGCFTLQRGMYFSLPEEGLLSGDGRGIIVTRLNYYGVFLVGGPREEVGRLQYIDGCTDSLLLPPVLMGDPCLNALYFPAGIKQTQHTHPSMRVGIIASGSGECITPAGNAPLTAGQIFVIPAESLHSFNTADDPMVVIAYHPDSDFGPTHEIHPMINRTMIKGVSASKRHDIRTRRSSLDRSLYE
jgi:mannose-6-phosphate isomerase-like protein (cupin superfamily)